LSSSPACVCTQTGARWARIPVSSSVRICAPARACVRVLCDQAFALPLSLMKMITLFPSVLTCFVHMCCIHQLSEREKIVGFKGLSHIGPLFHHQPPAGLPTVLLDHTGEEEEKKGEGCPHVSTGRYVRINSHKINTLT